MLEINLDLMVLTAIVFLVLIYLLNTMLYKPMLKFMDDREASILSSEKSVAATASDLSVHEAEIEAVLSKAREEAARIKSEASNIAKEEAAKKIEAKKLELEARYNEFKTQLNTQRQELRDELQDSVPALRQTLVAKLAKI